MRAVADLVTSRWQGRPGIEVWYTTLRDPRTGTGLWLHHELVAPTSGDPPRAHGWAAVFQPGRRPTLTRFGPHEWPRPGDGFRAGEVTWTAARHVGRAGDLAWDLGRTAGGVPLHPFPRSAWGNGLLPAVQVVAAPTARFSGTVRVGDEVLELQEAPGADARIRGRSNPERWGWLHADLGGGEVCEVVTAVVRGRGLDRLPPVALVRFRLDGEDRPHFPLLQSVGLRTGLQRDGWQVRGRLGRANVRIVVRLPEPETVEVDYVDPDGAWLLCRTSVLADAHVELFRHGRTVRSWTLRGTAHAEVGGFRGRPDGGP